MQVKAIQNGMELMKEESEDGGVVWAWVEGSCLVTTGGSGGGGETGLGAGQRQVLVVGC